MKANRELMMMQKVLLRDVNEPWLAKTPVTEMLGLKRIEIYDDELSF